MAFQSRRSDLYLFVQQSSGFPNRVILIVNLDVRPTLNIATPTSFARNLTPLTRPIYIYISRLSGHNFFIMKHAPQYQEMFHQPGDKRKRWHVYGFFFETNLGSTTECAADEVSFEDAWGKKEAGGPDWFLCDDTNIWPPDGG